MEPITLGVGVVVVSFLFGGGVKLGLNWSNIKRRITGNKISVVGATAVGKTTLIKFLTEGVIHDEYQETASRTKHEGRVFKLSDLQLVINKGIDVPGRHASRESWKTAVEEADILLYLFRIDQLVNGDSIATNRVDDDIAKIASWLSEKKKQPIIVLIGTYADKISESAQPNIKSLQAVKEITDRFFNDEAINRLRRNLGAHSKNDALLVIASLATTDDVRRCAQVLLERLAQ